MSSPTVPLQREAIFAGAIAGVRFFSGIATGALADGHGVRTNEVDMRAHHRTRIMRYPILRTRRAVVVTTDTDEATRGSHRPESPMWTSLLPAPG